MEWWIDGVLSEIVPCSTALKIQMQFILALDCPGWGIGDIIAPNS